MAFWWVNHNQTSKQEIAGGYVWSPKCQSNGRRSQFYDFMREMRVGDFIVSFSHAQIGHFGIVSGLPLSAPKPDEFGKTGEQWSLDGWLVRVAWEKVAHPFRPKDNIEHLRPFLPKRYSPIQENGNGNQAAYLTKIDEMLFSELEQLGSFQRNGNIVVEHELDDQAFIEEVEDQIATVLIQNSPIDSTETDAIIKARRGQGRFRQNIEQFEDKCRVSGVRDKRLLIGSHIKPWRVCETAEERLDGANGLLLAPHIDRLFDLGLITFGDTGTLFVSDCLDQETIDCLGLSKPEAREVGTFTSNQIAYLSYHRDNVFLG
ncbi:HNH endonuclease [Pseudovibrio sp. Alg231-02]|uniref:HNH endonuclease n=1 Tax=Pseudovibrio sp. Alg231-02 TaxID=1922223 RepID=UPI00131F174B|nr:HNH endonuclease [Pseudovibrio sp. Alg231-02]